MLVALGGIFGRHPFAGMLPHVAQRRGEGDVAARRLRIGRDIAHLVEEKLASVKGKARIGLMPEIGVILGVGYHRDSELPLPGMRRILRRTHKGRQQEQDFLHRHCFRLHEIISVPPGEIAGGTGMS
ncbi:hypothetical protein BV95_03292 [Sphingobium chlorophenolicum]|uniref:Uncharacterized protein n=1 Tax=Sphingobium chlorophenolicum TaxID=46429 RepID=A0A081RB25_SPHCR|nr:hypothetical protein BV95_03292 [Sphingobium chlorophenolicum]